MNYYNNKLNELLNKYNLYEEYSDKTIQEDLIQNIEKQLDNNSKYILLYDEFMHCMLSRSDFLKYIPNKYFIENYLIKNEPIDKQMKDITSKDEFKILVCTYYLNDKLLEVIKDTFPNNDIINVMQTFPKYISSKVGMAKLCILRKIEYFQTYLNKNNFTGFINAKKQELRKKLNTEPTVIIWGGGYHTKCLLNNTNLIDTMNIRYIVDSNPNLSGKNIHNIEIINKDRLQSVDFDTFLISSYEYENEIVKEIKNVFPSKNIIQLYESKTDWGELFNIELDTEDIFIESELLLNLIKLFLAIRDFYSASKCLDTYISRYPEKSNELTTFKQELCSLLSNIKNIVTTKKESNIQFMLVDALDKEGMDKYMDFLKKFGKENIYFENAYSASTYTTESHICMFNGKNLFENNLYLRNPVEIENCNWIRNLKENGYKIVASNSTHVIDNLFDIKLNKSDFSTPISKILWDNLCYVLQNLEKKTFMYSTFMEHHDSLTSATYKYIDIQLEYYSKFFGQNDFIFILSDHGYEFLCEKRIHIPLIIKTPSKKQMYVEQLFSTRNIGKIVLETIENKFDGVADTEYVKIERTPFYNKDLIEAFKATNKAKAIKAYRILHTLIDKYLIFEDGEEEYYLLCDENTNLINDSKYLDRINMFRKIHQKDGFPDFSKDVERYN